MVSPLLEDPASAVADFWSGIRQDDISGLVEETRTAITEMCGTVGTFSFEMISNPSEAASAGMLPVTAVEPGTPRTVVDAWNHNKLVSLVELSVSGICGAAIGIDVTETVKDFRACLVPLVGEGKCEIGNHQGPKTRRLIPPAKGEFFLAIATNRAKEVFSRPFLEESDLRYLPRGSPHYDRLLTIKMEARVWKTLFEVFPGAPYLMQQGQSPYLSSPPPKVNVPLKSELEEVSAAPITSPAVAKAQRGQSYQLEHSEGWNFMEQDRDLSEELSIEGSRKSTVSSQPKQAFPWESAFVHKRSPSLEESVDSAKPKSENWRGPFGELRQKLAALEKLEDIFSSNDVQLRASLEHTFSSMSREIQRLNEELRYTKTVLSEIQEQSRFGQVSTSTGISAQQLEEIMTEVRLAMDRQHYVTQADLQKTQLSLPPDIMPRLTHVEGEIFNDAGLVSQLNERVENLEAARATKAVDIGGFIFTDEAATDTWTRSLADKELHRLVPDFLSYFLLADPKFDTVKGGLDQMAAVAKAQYSSLDLATIVLAFSLTYPPNMMTKSEKVEAQVTDGIAWATPFATHEVFEGDYSNGTHKKVKKSLAAAAKSVDAGIDFSFPASTHPKANAVLKAQSTLAVAQCVEFLDSLSPLYKEIEGGGMSPKDSWVRCLAYAKQVFDVVRSTTELLKEYQLHNWVEHPKTSSILARTAMRKEGKALEDLVAKVQSHTTLVNSHAGDIKELQKDVKALKMKNGDSPQA
eukprot:CCRYP_002218-RA/>CCRYP_002218-RA protein AED:0.69 eAED:0.69 QI:0/0/0/1/0/0.5/2/0/747